MEQLWSMLQMKFSKNAPKNEAVQLAFRFPGGNYVFEETMVCFNNMSFDFCLYETIVFVQVLYQFVFSMGEVTQPLKIFDSFPRADLQVQ